MVKEFLDNPSNVEHYPNMAKLMRMYITGSVSNADVERGASHIKLIVGSHRTRLTPTSLNHTLFTCINGPSEEFNKSGLALRIARYYLFRRRRNVVTEGRLISPLMIPSELCSKKWITIFSTKSSRDAGN